MMVEGKTMAAELTAQSKGQLQIFSYWKSGGGSSMSGSVLQKSLGSLTISPSTNVTPKESSNHTEHTAASARSVKPSRRNIFEFITTTTSSNTDTPKLASSDDDEELLVGGEKSSYHNTNKSDNHPYEVHEETEIKSDLHRESTSSVQKVKVKAPDESLDKTGQHDDDNNSDCEIVEVKVDSPSVRETEKVTGSKRTTPPVLPLSNHPPLLPLSSSISTSCSSSSSNSDNIVVGTNKRVVRTKAENTSSSEIGAVGVSCEEDEVRWKKVESSEGHTGENESRGDCQKEDRNGNEGAEYVNENDTGVQIDYDSHHSQAVSKSRSAGCQAKEKKSAPVAQFGTIYQPAGPLIEPHKTPSECMPSGLETVKLPPDLKVTYQTHPPSSNNPSIVSSHSSQSSSSSNFSPTKSPSKKVSSSSTSTSSHHHHHHHQSQSSSSSRSEKASSRILHQPYKSTSTSTATGSSHHQLSTTPQQSLSSASSSASSSSLPRSSVQQSSSSNNNYSGLPGSSYVVSGTSHSGSPHLLSQNNNPSAAAVAAAAAMLSQQQQQQQAAAAAILQQQHHAHQQQLASSAAAAAAAALGGHLSGHHHHPIGSPSGVVGGPSSQAPQAPSASAGGAPSAGGLFYSTSAGFAPHHSPFAPCKYPMVPPDSYRTHSPYPNSFLYPSATPQPPSGQSYFMTPFYTPPLTPNAGAAPQAVVTGGIGTNQPRPLPLAHHPSAVAAAASLYHPQGPGAPHPSAVPSHLSHPSNYLVAASPHHSIQPSPTAPGHAGLFHPNQSTQPACPCPTESYPLSSTNSSNKPQLQPQSASSVSLPALEDHHQGGAKQPPLLPIKSTSQQALVSATATRPSRHSTKDIPPHQQPPTCTTPAVAADPPVTIQLLNSNVVNVKQTQDRQLESAKTFTEQYSLPDDITITPIIVSNANTNNALLMINSSISIVTTSAPSSSQNTSTTLSGNANSNNTEGGVSNNSSSSTNKGKKKEKDIVHLIDPRSGTKTTIAKHISTKNLLARTNTKSPTKSRSKSPPKERSHAMMSGSAASSAVSRLKSNMNKIGSIKVGKLNPDLDVIVINNSNNNNNRNLSGSCGDVSNVSSSDLDHISQNGKLTNERMLQSQQKKVSPIVKRRNKSVVIDPNMYSYDDHDNQPTDAYLSNGPVTLTSQQVIMHMSNNKSTTAASNNKAVPQKGNHRGQILPRRIALVGSDNNSQHKLVPKKVGAASLSNKTSLEKSSHNPSLNPPPAFSYSLPPGISISPGVGANLSITPSAFHNNNSQNVSSNLNVRPMTVQNYQQQHQHQVLSSQNTKQQGSNNKKRISLNECIDGLQKKRMKLLEDHNLLPTSGSSEAPTVGNHIVRGSGGNKKVPAGTLSSNKNNGRLQNSGIVFPVNKANLARNKAMIDAGSTSARVRDPEGFSMGSTVIKSSDAIVAVSALVVDPESYHAGRNARAAAAMTAAVRGHNSTTPNFNTTTTTKNGLKRANANKLQRSKSLVQSSSSGKNRVGSNSSKGGGGVVLMEVKAGGARSTRSSAANAKIRTRLSTKPKDFELSGLNSRSRSRLLRQRNQIISGGRGGRVGGATRKSESDCSSTNTSRSSSAVRLAGGNGPSGGGKVERGNKYSTQAYINAVADLYQYRRNVMLRVPKAGVGIFPSASSVKLLNNIPSSSSSGTTSLLSPGITALGGGQQVGANSFNQLQQLSPGNNSQNIQNVILGSGGSSSRSNSPSLLPTTSTSMGTSTSKGPVGSMAASAAKKRAVVKPLSPSAVNGALLQLGIPRRTPKWSNGWRFEGEPYEAKVLVNNDDGSVLRVCYPAMRHESGDVIQTRDCVLLKSGSRKNDLPYIAKIAALWENPSDGEMMFSLLWYYRPEHTEMGRTKDDMMDEVFASKHIDVNSVATIDDRCYVLTFNEYCRYRKRLKQLEDGLPNKPLLTLTGSSMINNNAAGNIACAVWSGRASSEDPTRAPSPGKISPEVVFFCRKVYDFRQKRIMKNPS